jgi:hypothetical protein
MYSAIRKNCQDFVMLVLNSNKLNTFELEKFVKQDASQLVPGFVEKFAKKVTNLAGILEVLVKGKGIHGMKVRKRIKYGKKGGCEKCLRGGCNNCGKKGCLHDNKNNRKKAMIKKKINLIKKLNDIRGIDRKIRDRKKELKGRRRRGRKVITRKKLKGRKRSFAFI